jgi:hypothetical protein
MRDFEIDRRAMEGLCRIFVREADGWKIRMEYANLARPRYHRHEGYLFDGTAGINNEGVLRSLQGSELALEQSLGKKVIFPFSQSFRQRELINVKEDKVDSRQAFLHNLPVRFLEG